MALADTPRCLVSFRSAWPQTSYTHYSTGVLLACAFEQGRKDSHVKNWPSVVVGAIVVCFESVSNRWYESETWPSPGNQDFPGYG